MKSIHCVHAFAFALGLSGLHAETQRVPSGVGIEEKLGQTIPTQLSFLDEAGKRVQLKEFLDGRRPLLLIPSYYSCVRLCSFIFQGIQQTADAAAASGMKLGRDYRIVSLSINPRDDIQTARQKGEEMRAAFQQLTVLPEHWHFLSGTDQAVRSLMDALGYSYRWDPDGSNDISHTAAVALLSPRGKIMRYLYGVQFPERDFRLSLVEAANGRIGSAAEKILLYCFRYDPVEGKYTPFAWAFVRIGAVLTLCLLLGLWFFLRISAGRGRGYG